MDTKILPIALISLVIGIGGGYALAANKTPDQHMMANGNMMHGSMHSGMQGEMEGLSEEQLMSVEAPSFMKIAELQRRKDMLENFIVVRKKVVS